MIDFRTAHLRTAGAYVTVDGLYLFAIGAIPHDGSIPVYRLGGHVDEGETGWECARREAAEEARIQIEPVEAEATYLVSGNRPELELVKAAWEADARARVSPLVVVSYCLENYTTLSLMYRARAAGTPAPGSEVKGILLLDPDSILRICREPVTLDEYLQSGGRAVLKHDFDRKLRLEPFIQLRILGKILATLTSPQPLS